MAGRGFIAIFILVLCLPGFAFAEDGKKGFYTKLPEYFQNGGLRIRVVADGGKTIAGSREIDGKTNAFVWRQGQGFMNYTPADDQTGSVRSVSDDGGVVAGAFWPADVGWYCTTRKDNPSYIYLDDNYWKKNDFFYTDSQLRELHVSADGGRIAGSVGMVNAFLIDTKNGNLSFLPGTAHYQGKKVDEAGNPDPYAVAPGADQPVWANGERRSGKLAAMSRDGKRFILDFEIASYTNSYIVDDSGKYLRKLTVDGKEARQYLDKGYALGKYVLLHAAHISGIHAFALSYDGRYAVGGITLQYADGAFVGGHPLTDEFHFPVRWDTQTGEPLVLSEKPLGRITGGEISDDGKLLVFTERHDSRKFWREGKGVMSLDELARESGIAIPEEEQRSLVPVSLSYDGRCVAAILKQREKNPERNDEYRLLCFEGDNPFEGE